MKQFKEFFKEKITFSFTLRGETLISAVISKCKEGFIIEVHTPTIKGVHTTCLEDEDRVSWHLTDPSLRPDDLKMVRRSNRGELAKEDYISHVRGLFNESMLVEYSPDDPVWIPTESCRNGLMKIYNPKGLEDAIPLELVLSPTPIDLHDASSWEKITINDLVDKGYNFGIVPIGDEIRFVRPLTQTKMVRLSKADIDRIAQELESIFGMDKLMAYLTEERKVPEEMKKYL